MCFRSSGYGSPRLQPARLSWSLLMLTATLRNTASSCWRPSNLWVKSRRSAVKPSRTLRTLEVTLWSFWPLAAVWFDRFTSWSPFWLCSSRASVYVPPCSFTVWRLVAVAHYKSYQHFKNLSCFVRKETLSARCLRKTPQGTFQREKRFYLNVLVVDSKKFYGTRWAYFHCVFVARLNLIKHH